MEIDLDITITYPCKHVWYRSNEFARTNHKHVCTLDRGHTDDCTCECGIANDFFQRVRPYQAK